MKKAIYLFTLIVMSLTVQAQDSMAFKGYIYNAEYQVYIRMNFQGNDIEVPGQTIYGKLPGFLGAIRDTRKWLFTAAEITDANTAKLQITNDYGSEDLTATLTKNKDDSYTLRQKDGSTIKIVVARKWVKLPKEITFTRANGTK